MQSLLEKLKKYQKSDYYGFHMPGHKRNTALLGEDLPFGIDITEIEGFDDLNHPRGILKEACEKAANLYQSEDSLFLVNGSTVGLLSAIKGVTNKGDRILVARNCHKSVFNAINLFYLNPVYLYPQMNQSETILDEIKAEDVKEMLKKYPDIKAMVMVSPTYEGVVSDIDAISRILHEQRIPLILDEAHGAHFGFHERFPQSGVTRGADIVIHSLHKTMPSLTQTGLMHLNGALIDKENIKNTLSMLQSSSPSYVLMASIDNCISFMQKEAGKKAMATYVKNLLEFRDYLKDLNHLEIIKTDHFDLSKIVISTAKTKISGYELQETLLKNYHLQMEMATKDYVIAMTTLGDTKEGFRRLQEALFAMDKKVVLREKKAISFAIPRLEKIYESHEIANKEIRIIELKTAKGQISTSTIYLYPPGIPLILPGERISQEVINMIQWYQENEIIVEGLEEQKIRVLKDE
ncbi:MAG TPA: aminotransferase class I/II-fold pyridoxal phosphate-dependent enzyme [Candidatus Dorea intestinavium]|nr:aminotransferase class I/II-fold pyridoxal phosphate-dependent enzyme [Candidatus Dorea intestinavium]